jgi:hypothetical protein
VRSICLLACRGKLWGLWDLKGYCRPVPHLFYYAHPISLPRLFAHRHVEAEDEARSAAYMKRTTAEGATENKLKKDSLTAALLRVARIFVTRFSGCP